MSDARTTVSLDAHMRALLAVCGSSARVPPPRAFSLRCVHACCNQCKNLRISVTHSGVGVFVRKRRQDLGALIIQAPVAKLGHDEAVRLAQRASASSSARSYSSRARALWPARSRLRAAHVSLHTRETSMAPPACAMAHCTTRATARRVSTYTATSRACVSVSSSAGRRGMRRRARATAPHLLHQLWSRRCRNGWRSCEVAGGQRVSVLPSRTVSTL